MLKSSHAEKLKSEDRGLRSDVGQAEVASGSQSFAGIRLSRRQISLQGGEV